MKGSSQQAEAGLLKLTNHDTVTMREKQCALAPIHTFAAAVENTSQLENEISVHIWAILQSSAQ